MSFLQTLGSKGVQKNQKIDKMTCNATIERITVLGSFSMTCVFELIGLKSIRISHGLGLELRLVLKLGQAIFLFHYFDTLHILLRC